MVHAGGVAFPNSQAVLVPADRPGDILVTGNVGIVTSHDGGQTWTWACEDGPAAGAFGHQVGPAPRDRLFALAGSLIYSDDGACSWQTAGGVLAGNSTVSALFADPTDADRVFAAAQVSGGDGGAVFQLLESSDGGATFGTVRYTSSPSIINSVRSTHGTTATGTIDIYIYLTLYTGANTPPTLMRSSNGGSTWAPIDLGSAVGAGRLEILAIDPNHADKLFLRFVTASAESLVMVDGTAVTRPVQILGGGALTAFVRASDGTLMAAGLNGATASLFRSDDGGASFIPLTGPPHINGLAERGGVFYAATDPGKDGFAEATSTDDGVTWQRGLNYLDVQAIAPCLKASCQSDCTLWVGQGLWEAAVCSADPTPTDGGGADGPIVGGRDGVVDAGRDASADIVVRDGAADHKEILPSRGCHCGLTSTSDRSGASSIAAGAFVALACAAVRARAGRKRRAGSRTSPRTLFRRRP